MDNLKMFTRRREARRKCAYLQSILDEGTMSINISNPRKIYKLWKDVDRIKSKNYIKNKDKFSYNFFTLLRENYKNFAIEKLESNEDIEKEIAYICYALGM